MECALLVDFVRNKVSIFLGFILFIQLAVDGNGSLKTDGKIISTQDEVIAYVNHTGKLSCIIENRQQRYVTWSRVQPENDTQKLLALLFVNSHRYTPSTRYHLTYMIENDNKESWNLEIRHVHPSDQGFYSCVLTASPSVSKLFQLKVLEPTRNPTLALRSTSDMQRRTKDSGISLASFSTLSYSIVSVSLCILLASKFFDCH